jgi:DNA-binding NarL/FixJ family response regulator
MSRHEPILLIEDNLSDIENITNALKTIELKSPLIHMNTFEEALVYLNNRKNLPPLLILLGLNEENSNGLNFLKTIKADENMKQIPVVIFALSNEQQNVVKSFKLGVAGYMVKSEVFSKLNETIKTIMEYWTLSELPPVGERYHEDPCYCS